MSGVESTLVNSIVGPGTLFKGNVTVSGLFRVDGDFVGSIKSSGRVIVGRGGRADCTIDAATIIIGGVFRGTVYASEKVIALESAVIIGSIYSPRLVAESGVYLNGSVRVRGIPQPNAADADGARFVADNENPPVQRQKTGRPARRSRSSSTVRIGRDI